MPRGNRPWTAACTSPGRKERQRYRHIGLSDATSFACSNLLDSGGAGNDLIKPTAAARDRCNKRGASLHLGLGELF